MSAQLGAGADLGRTIWGMPGLGAFGFQLQEAPGDRRIVTTTRSHSNKVVTDCVEAMEPHEVVRVGGAGNKVSWIFSVHSVQPGKRSPTYPTSVQVIQLVEGRASAYVFASPGCKKWDTCAPEAILTAVGGTDPRSAIMDPSHAFLLSQSFLVYGAGKLTDMHGNAYRYDANVKHMNSAGVLATLRNHEYYISRVPQSALQALKTD